MTVDIVSVAATISFIYMNKKQRTWRFDQVEHVIMSNIPALVEHRDKSSQWWTAQLIKFVLRPSEYTLKHIVWPLQQAAFYLTEGVLPHPLAAVFIRAGDKFKEARPMSVDAHFAELAPFASKLGIKDVYVGSDSRDRIVYVESNRASEPGEKKAPPKSNPNPRCARERVAGTQDSWPKFFCLFHRPAVHMTHTISLLVMTTL